MIHIHMAICGVYPIYRHPRIVGHIKARGNCEATTATRLMHGHWLGLMVPKMPMFVEGWVPMASWALQQPESCWRCTCWESPCRAMRCLAPPVCMGVSIVMGVPPNHPFIDGFSLRNQPAIGGTPMTMETPTWLRDVGMEFLNFRKAVLPTLRDACTWPRKTSALDEVVDLCLAT